MIKELLKKKLAAATKRKIRNFIQDIKAFGRGRDLNKLGRIYGTDKIGEHFYTPHYMTHLRRFKYKRINLFEIGVGGGPSSYFGANSLRMWKKYFPFGKIFSLDIHEKSSFQENRIIIFQGNQIDKDFLNKIAAEMGELDIIIDDGSHMNAHVIETFNILFPKLKDGGIYVIEDTQTSYLEEYGGDSRDLNNPQTTMSYFKSLTDSLNSQEFVIPDYERNYFAKKIISMHFYHNLIFVYKGNNDEKSNLAVISQK
ncbi:MAG: class I SAM-dependent methyltransferase [Candidatus Komeilibacteria bacterium]|nr:class I SAM-dependent methyltransferase [Candidatus Komeilibacteria bacterium]